MSLPTVARILSADHYETAVIIAITVLLGALLVHVCWRLRSDDGNELPVERGVAAKEPSFWRRWETRMEQAEPDASYGNLLERLQGWPMAGVPFAMLAAGWVIYAVVPALSTPVIYAVLVLTGAVLAYYTFLLQPPLDVHLLLLHLATAVLTWSLAIEGSREAGFAIGSVAAALLLFQAFWPRTKVPAARGRKPAVTQKSARWKPEETMALVAISVQVLIGVLMLYEVIPNIGPAAGLPLVGVVPWLLNHLMERAQSYQMPALRSPWFLVPIAPAAWLLQVAFGLLLHFLRLSTAVPRHPQQAPEPDPKGGRSGVWTVLARVAPILLLCGGQFLLWQASAAVRAQTVLAIHVFLAGAFVLHCLTAGAMALEGRRDPIGHALVAARAMARSLSVLSLLMLPVLFMSIVTGAWRQSVWPWAYLGVIVVGLLASAMQKPEPAPAETKSFRAAGGR